MLEHTNPREVFMAIDPHLTVELYRWTARAAMIGGVIFGTTWQRRLVFIGGSWLCGRLMIRPLREMAQQEGGRRKLAAAWKTYAADLKYLGRGARPQGQPASPVRQRSAGAGARVYDRRDPAA